MIRSAKESYFSKYILNCDGDQNKLFNIVNSLLGRNNQTVFPQADCDFTLANYFFTDNIIDICTNFTEVELRVSTFNNVETVLPKSKKNKKLCWK